MIDLTVWLAFALASVALVVVPGPTVTVIVANSLRHGARAGLLNVAGTQIGLAGMIVVLAVGLSAVVEALGWAFDWLRLLGAAYLVWLGVKMWRSDGRLAERDARPLGGSFFWQGFVVIWSNPKALFFLGAFLPQFIDPQRSAAAQVVLMGLTFMAVATLIDGAYALVAGRAGSWLTRGNVRLVERLSGTFLIGGGLWLALRR